MVWSYYDLVASAGISAAPRAQHSAVLVDQTNLFILSGLDKDAQYTSDLLILDVRNILSNISFTDHFPFDNNDAPITPSLTSSSASGFSSSRGGLSTGSIAGIAVGAVIVYSALALLTLLYLCRKRRNKKQGTTGKSNLHHYEQHDTQMLEVDWDKIEDQYKKILPLPFQGMQQQQKHHHQGRRQSSMIKEFHSEPTTTIEKSSSSSTKVTKLQVPDVLVGKTSARNRPSSTAVSPKVAAVIDKPDTTIEA